MSNKNKDYNKKWLITRLKTSGSKRRYVIDGDYSKDRNRKRNKDWENLPTQQGMGKSYKFYNNKINYGLLIRFLRRKVGCNWSEVHEEIISRIPTNLIEYKDCIKWFVADLVEKREAKIWDKREQKYILLNPGEPYDFNISIAKEFYVDPDSNLLVRVKDFPSNRRTKGMSSDELRKFRENENQTKLEMKRKLKNEHSKNILTTKEILQNHNKNTD